MSYVRMGEEGSDVYLYPSGGMVVCQWCKLGADVALSPEETLRHLGAHMAAGHRVPARVFARLEDEGEPR